MNIKAILDVDMLAIESNDEITLMLDLTAPQNPLHANRDGQAVQIVLDRSGSMSGQPLAAAKNSLLRLVERLAPQDSFGLVAFDDSALVVIPTKKSQIIICLHYRRLLERSPPADQQISQLATSWV